MSNIRFTPWFVFNYMQLFDLKPSDLTSEELEHTIRDIKVIAHYQLANTRMVVTYMTIPFVFMVTSYDDGTYEFTLWGISGAEHIKNWNLSADEFDSDFRGDFVKTMHNYCKGIISCAECGEPMMRDKQFKLAEGVTRTYQAFHFASRYCNVCVETNDELRKRIESENYN